MIHARVRCGQNSTLSLCLESVRAITNAIYSADSVHTTPAQATYWRTRTMAEHAGLSHTTVHRIGSVHELKPHRLRRLPENDVPDCAGISFVFKARQQAHSRAMSLLA